MPQVWGGKLSNDKAKTVLFEVLYSKESNPWIGGHSDLEAVEYSPQEILGKTKFYKALEETTQKQGTIG